MTNSLLQANQLSKKFGNQLAVNDVSFSINKGEVLGFLGPNGAGKSTSMKMLSGNLAPDYGQITINGFDLIEQPKVAKAQIGYLPETPPLYKELSVIEFLSFCARLNLIPVSKRNASIDFTLQRCGLTEVRKRLIGNLSKGFQQRLGIAQAIIHSPAVVILDEPTSGLDPIQIREIRQLIRDIAVEHSVILSTHILPEVQMLCDRVQIMSQGQLLFNDSIDKLNQQMSASSILVEMNNPPAQTRLSQIEYVSAVEQLSDTKYRIHYQPDFDPTQSLLADAIQHQWQLTMLLPEQHSLEEVFMKIIQHEETDV